MDAGERTIDVALDVSRILDELQIRHAMIGAAVCVTALARSGMISKDFCQAEISQLPERQTLVGRPQ